MGSTVIGVVRTATALEALTYEVGDRDAREPWQCAQRCALRPLSERTHQPLVAAWRSLAAVARWDATTAANVLVVLRETVPGLEAPGALPALAPAIATPPAPRATAAHPRAYRGTKHRPPRPPQAAVVDVRPYLVARRHVDEVLGVLGQPRGGDPYVAWHHGGDTSGLDPWFVTYVLPLLRGCAWSDVGAFAALARGGQLHRDPALYAALVGVYLAAGDPARARAWWSHVLAYEPGRQHEIAQQVRASGVAMGAPPDPAEAAVIATLDARTRWSVWRALAGGASAAYVLAGVQLGAITGDERECVPAGQVDGRALVDATLARLAGVLEDVAGWRRDLWWLCARPSFVELLASPALHPLDPDAAAPLLNLATCARSCPEDAAAWAGVEARWSELVALAAELAPAYQEKFIDSVRAVCGYAASTERDVLDVLAKCVGLCVRLARPPFAREDVVGALLPHLALADDDGVESWHLRHVIADAPDACWRALEARGARANHRRLVGWGLYRIGQVAPALLTTFVTSPGALVQTADALAALSVEHAARVLRTYAASPLAAPALADASLERLCELVEPVARAGGPDPVRRALRRHRAGEITLTSAQLAGHRARIVAALGIVRLAAIRQAVERELAARLGIATIEAPALRHAASMLHSVDVDRRQLRRLLRAVLAGDRAYAVRHPRSQAWFARHPRLDVARWLEGVEVCGDVPGLGEIRLAIERDPLEALELGTYVGTCLGRGGELESAAATVVLDVNKQVVYARDARGTVVARQLLALAEHEDALELVSFAVYGSASLGALEPLFRTFSDELATRLGIPRHRGDDAFVITTILSGAWWDDATWMDRV